MDYVTNPTPVAELLKLYRKNKKVYETKKIMFLGLTDEDVYNISPSFQLGKASFIAGRVEKRDSEISKVMFFKKIEQDMYILDQKAIVLEYLQDPCISWIDRELIIGGTKIETDPENPNHIISWNTSFYRGKKLEELKYFASAPKKMKDVRICKYKNKIAVFTRPQGHGAGPGKIGFLMIDSLAELNAEHIEKATIFSNHFIESEWGGANEVHVLKNGLLGVLGHISTRDLENNLHYYPMVFAFNPKTFESTQVKIIAERSDFTPGPSKRPDLIDVLFSGGIVRIPEGKAILYTGVSDAEAHYIIINDPFMEYEI
jgi:hypothetical protein